MAAVTRPNTEF